MWFTLCLEFSVTATIDNVLYFELFRYPHWWRERFMGFLLFMANALEISGLKKTYDNGFRALKGIDLSVEKGDFFALLGPNGAGKSTILGIVCSLVNKTSGEVRVFGYDTDTHLSKAKLNLGVVPQEFNFNQFDKVMD